MPKGSVHEARALSVVLAAHARVKDGPDDGDHASAKARDLKRLSPVKHPYRHDVRVESQTPLPRDAGDGGVRVAYVEARLSST